jgi:hypothetical protein
VGAELVGHRDPVGDEILSCPAGLPQSDGLRAVRDKRPEPGPVGTQLSASTNASNRSSLLPADPYRPRRFLTWFGLITTTVNPASSRASTTGPSGRSMATSPTPSLRSRRVMASNPAWLCSVMNRSTWTPSVFTTATA